MASPHLECFFYDRLESRSNCQEIGLAVLGRPAESSSHLKEHGMGLPQSLRVFR